MFAFAKERLRRKNEHRFYHVFIVAAVVLAFAYIVLPGIDYAVEGIIAKKILFEKILAVAICTISICHAIAFMKEEKMFVRISYALGMPASVVALFHFFIS